MKAVITEKPSVAREIASVLGAKRHREGFIEGNGYKITWAFGHLIELAMPEDYGWTGFRKENLPMIPDKFKLLVRRIKDGKERKKDNVAVQQLNIIKEIFNEAEEIIVATDAGREGELIFRYIYQYLRCKKPFRRLWISSMTNKAILDGFANLRPGSDYDNLYTSALFRSQADWLVGLNASQALSISAHGSYSLGRVQTPTLKMVCERFLENRHFESRTYWQIKLNLNKDGNFLQCLSDEKYNTKEPASGWVTAIRNEGKVQVVDIVKKEHKQEPPLLYDLTSLQKEANTQLDYSAESTLKIAQSLYEKKVLSYPRTGSRYISDDVFEQIPFLISLLKGYPPLASAAGETEKLIYPENRLNAKSVDSQKVTDHHALIITENPPRNLSAEEEAIYRMVATRMLEAFSPASVKDITTLYLCAAGCRFTAKGSVVKISGWKNIRNVQEEELQDQNLTETEDNPCLPVLKIGDTLDIDNCELLEKQTRPRPLHTESSLLAAMETAGKDIDDEELRASMQDIGIGTPATRAAIIETLFKRDYIIREKKNLVPTAKGLAVYEIVKDQLISDVALTGKWEAELNHIAKGEKTDSHFESDIKEFTKLIINQLLEINPKVFRDLASSRPYPTVPCPSCGGEMRIMAKSARCQNKDCNLNIWKEFSGKKLTEKQFMTLVSKGKTSLIKGFINPSGEKFDASLIIEGKRVIYRKAQKK